MGETFVFCCFCIILYLLQMCDVNCKRPASGLSPSSVSDPRLLELNNVLLFFRNWRDQLSSQSMEKSERASCFIGWQTMFDLQVNNPPLTVISNYFCRYRYKISQTDINLHNIFLYDVCGVTLSVYPHWSGKLFSFTNIIFTWVHNTKQTQKVYFFTFIWFLKGFYFSLHISFKQQIMVN